MPRCRKSTRPLGIGMRTIRPAGHLPRLAARVWVLPLMPRVVRGGRAGVSRGDWPARYEIRLEGVLEERRSTKARGTRGGVAIAGRAPAPTRPREEELDGRQRAAA